MAMFQMFPVTQSNYLDRLHYRPRGTESGICFGLTYWWSRKLFNGSWRVNEPQRSDYDLNSQTWRTSANMQIELKSTKRNTFQHLGDIGKKDGFKVENYSYFPVAGFINELIMGGDYNPPWAVLINHEYSGGRAHAMGVFQQANRPSVLFFDSNHGQFMRSKASMGLQVKAHLDRCYDRTDNRTHLYYMTN